jgi:hypothetical protein
MKTTVYRSEFHNYFSQAGRSEQFSYEAKDLLFDYFEEYEESTGEEIELDIIAICCEYEETHYSDIIEQYDTDIEDEELTDEDEKIEYIRNWLNDNTQLVGESSEGVFVYQQF